MYSAPYGFPNTVPGSGGVPNFNGGAPPQQQQSPHMQQPGPSPNQAQMMYSNQQQQQFPSMTTQGHFSGANPAAMMAAAGPAAMMQNPGMPHMTPNGQMPYQQQPFTSSPYGGGVPATAAPQPQFPPNYAMAGQMPHQFQANAAGMSQQQMQQQMMQQRMYPGQQNGPAMGVSTPQRPFNPRQGTPGQSTPSQQGQFVAPPNQQGAPQTQISNNAQQQPPMSVTTPQTPTFPSNGQGPTANGSTKESTPLSPGTQSRDAETFSILLNINQELLYESIQLQNTRAELRKEQSSAGTDGGGSVNGDAADKMKQEKLIQMDYAQCMRRLQGNLTYLAALADRKVGQVPTCPAHLMPPPLNLGIKMRLPTPEDATEPDPEREEKEKALAADREERDKLMKELYKKLQAQFPGIDPRREPAFAVPGAQQQPSGQRPGAPGGGSSSNQGSPAPTPQTQRSGQIPTSQAGHMQPMQQAAGGS
ncbi:hypothetical protein GE09DRAFT_1121875 [Coniochaeta sp. 2T2.1]|nr:hypothetical protein GE09DRAFT_1121875 [Coniochaeta sp. 2T2.1]